MTCPHEARVLHLGGGPVPSAEQQALHQHAESCPHCRQALAAVASAREVLQQDRRAPHPSASVRVWARVEAQRGRAWPAVPGWAFAAAAAALVAAVFFARFGEPTPTAPRLEAGRLLADGAALRPGDEVVMRAELVAEAPARLVTGDAEVDLMPGATLRLSPYAARRSLDLTAGKIAVSPRAEGTPMVRTRAVGIAVLAGRVTVEAEGDVAIVRVERGRARAEVPDAAPETLSAGAERRYRVRTAAPPAPSAPADPPSPPAQAAAKPRPAPRPSPPARAPRDDSKSLEVARAVLPAEPERARAMAEDVLDSKPDARLEVEALALIADAERRSGRLRDALVTYGRVVEHPRGETYAEEALFRQAMLRDALGDARGALDTISVAERRFSGGVLAPERATLEARLHLTAGRPKAAAYALERVPEAARSLTAARYRVEVGEALQPLDPAWAARLVAPALDAPDPELRRRAANVGSR